MAASSRRMPDWIDTHAHLDGAEFDADREAAVDRARRAGVGMVVVPAVAVANFDAVRALAHRHGLAYALGIHPMCTNDATDADLDALERALDANRDDPRLVAVGEIGLDGFVAGLDEDRQRRVFTAQLAIAARAGLPVVLHSRKAVDGVWKALRQQAGKGHGGIAHAFNGSEQQARIGIDLGLVFGFGGALTFNRALHIRRLARSVPLDAVVMETDSPDIAPQWLYRTADARAAGATMRNEPAELARIGTELAALRGIDVDALAASSSANARRALPKLDAWMATREPALPA